MLFNEELDTLETDLLVTDSELDGDQAEAEDEVEMDDENDDEVAPDEADEDAEEASEEEAA